MAVSTGHLRAADVDILIECLDALSQGIDPRRGRRGRGGRKLQGVRVLKIELAPGGAQGILGRTALGWGLRARRETQRRPQIAWVEGRGFIRDRAGGGVHGNGGSRPRRQVHPHGCGGHERQQRGSRQPLGQLHVAILPGRDRGEPRFSFQYSHPAWLRGGRPTRRFTPTQLS
jgi:hypothetical protein